MYLSVSEGLEGGKARWDGGGWGSGPIFNGPVMVGPEKVAFLQRPEEGEGESCADIQGKSIPGRGDGHDQATRPSGRRVLGGGGGSGSCGQKRRELGQIPASLATGRALALMAVSWGGTRLGHLPGYQVSPVCRTGSESRGSPATLLSLPRPWAGCSSCLGVGPPCCHLPPDTTSGRKLLFLLHVVLERRDAFPLFPLPRG